MENCDRRSRLTGRHYNPFDPDVVRIVNILQATAYMNNDVLPIDIYVSKDRQSDKNILVFLFSREETKEVYDLWCKRELKQEVRDD